MDICCKAAISLGISLYPFTRLNFFSALKREATAHRWTMSSPLHRLTLPVIVLDTEEQDSIE